VKSVIKVIALLKRKSGITHEEFSRHWEEKHGPLAARMLRPWFRGYIQDHVEPLPGAEEPPIDGLDEMWVDDLESWQALYEFYTGDEGKPMLDDEAQFLDSSSTIVFLVDQKFMVKPVGGIKVIALLQRKKGTAHEDFSRHWEKEHGPLAARMLPWFKGYIQDHVVPLPGAGKPPIDGLDEMWADDLESWQALFGFHEGDEGKPMRDDEEEFLDTASIQVFLVDQKFMIGSPEMQYS
jgi:uncharacterized protein (TIGR02118 family)